MSFHLTWVGKIVSIKLGMTGVKEKKLTSNGTINQQDRYRPVVLFAVRRNIFTHNKTEL